MLWIVLKLCLITLSKIKILQKKYIAVEASPDKTGETNQDPTETRELNKISSELYAL